MSSFSTTEPRRTWIYALRDPRDGAVRYVGKTTKGLDERLHGHLKLARLRPKSHRDWWIRSLGAVGLTPQIEVIEEGHWSTANSNFRECYWNESLSMFYDLTNHTPGGDGLVDYNWTSADRAKISAGVKAMWARPGHREKHAESFRSMWASPDFRAPWGERHAAGMQKMRQKRRKCLECERVFNPIGLATHQRRADHSGFTDVTEDGDRE